jgi:MbtH protein
MSEIDTPEREHRVVVNHEEQYSTWPTDRELPAGWRDTQVSGSESACLAHIDMVWTDMRPLSLRRAMERPGGSRSPSP